MFCRVVIFNLACPAGILELGQASSCLPRESNSPRGSRFVPPFGDWLEWIQEEKNLITPFRRTLVDFFSTVERYLEAGGVRGDSSLYKAEGFERSGEQKYIRNT